MAKQEIEEKSLAKHQDSLPEKREILDISPEETRRKFQAIHEFQKIVKDNLHENHDYGIIPGTGNKPTLLKPGAEKIAKLLSCFDDYIEMGAIEDWDKPFFHYKYKCILYDMATETKISSGIGECNSMETKYRYRWTPEWELPEDIKAIRDTLKYKVVQYRKKAGTFKLYRFDNDEIFSLVNTILKMAKKRALVDAALSAGRLSDLFTQDLEDNTNNFNSAPKEEEAKPATHEQQTEIGRLISSLVDKFESDPDVIMETLEKKFKITDLKTATESQAKKTIAYLKKAIKGKEKDR